MRSKQSTRGAAVFAAMLVTTAPAMLVGPETRAAAAGDANPYLWLGQIHGRKALAWAEAQSGRSDLALEGDPAYARDRSQILEVLNANTRIPEGTLDHDWVINFWQDADHLRGVWRRTTIADYARRTPHWQTLLDIDQLDK